MYLLSICVRPQGCIRCTCYQSVCVCVCVCVLMLYGRSRRWIDVCFSPVVTLYGWLGSKHQLTNFIVVVFGGGGGGSQTRLTFELVWQQIPHHRNWDVAGFFFLKDFLVPYTQDLECTNRLQGVPADTETENNNQKQLRVLFFVLVLWKILPCILYDVILEKICLYILLWKSYAVLYVISCSFSGRGSADGFSEHWPRCWKG